MFLSVLIEIHPLINPEIGLSIWTIITFLILLIVLRIFAWKPITTAIKKREQFINDSLEKASTAKEELLELQIKKDEIIKEAENRKLEIIKEAENIKQKAIQDAEVQAKQHIEELKRINLEQLNAQKKQVLLSIEKDVAKIAVDIAEKILMEKLNNKDMQESFIDKLAKNIKI